MSRGRAQCSGNIIVRVHPSPLTSFPVAPSQKPGCSLEEGVKGPARRRLSVPEGAGQAGMRSASCYSTSTSTSSLASTERCVRG